MWVGRWAIECEGLTHRYGDHVVLDKLDLRIERGEIFGLLGPNGAGKTTTIRLLTTLMPVREGSVRVLGFEAGRRDTDIRYNLGYVPQQLSIEASLTGRQNVTWFARLFDVARRERAQRVEEVLAAMDLLEVADRPASGYSGGMVRRLELAQALINRPALLILDEPTVGLDPIARDGVWERVRDLRRRFGTTVLLTTHYMAEADALCDRIALLHKGVLRAVGAPAELRHALGPTATLEDVFRHHAGAGLDEESTTEGGLRNVRSTRRSAQRAG
ncbi:ATP-binding cassette domain-containing protein [Nocardia sp. CDC159]|uniref:ATP-binding cassette domain-containing protein n=1 Tax=Nocardia pulmonis TaxID=2951408 RepID=A0A9X2EF69_9NOCA|nr:MULTISPECIES: ATP-binding cassette domain-containing protein [Nocardia]MCM6777873.1 ATP-binding cassette domain-containing protein [Nocardia pulmonis]MCM6790757.1 ATP-binding cassette domain-containing protein [Nocardia sp. CDC159]